MPSGGTGARQLQRRRQILNADHHLGGSQPWVGMAADRPPLPPRQIASAPLPPMGPPSMPPLRRENAAAKAATVVPCLGGLSCRQATGRDSPPHR
jgi:hypothetical protein